MVPLTLWAPGQELSHPSVGRGGACCFPLHHTRSTLSSVCLTTSSDVNLAALSEPTDSAALGRDGVSSAAG